MKIGVIRRILKEDLAKADNSLPAWLDAMLYPLNQFITVVSQALSNNLTLKDNFFGRETTQAFTHGVELQIDPQVKTKVKGIFIQSIDASSADTATLISSWGWVTKSNGKIGITFNFLNGTSATKQNVTFFIQAT